MTAEPPFVSLRGVRIPGRPGEPGAGLDLGAVRGASVSLLGAPGCGNSEALLTLAGFLRPDGGEVLLDGRSVLRLPPRRRGVAYVPRDCGLLPHLTLRENVALGARIARAPAGSAERALDALGIDAEAGRRTPRESSDAFRRRTAIARALAGAPQVLALDHILSVLDPSPREELRTVLHDTRTAFPVTMLLATDDFADAAALSDRIAVVVAGIVVQTGGADEVYHRPATLEASRATGEINLLPGTAEAVDADEGTVSVRLAPGLITEAEDAGCGGAGSRVVVAIRPERVAVVAASAAELGENAHPAMVRGATVRGDHLRLTLALGEAGTGATLIARRPAVAGAAGFNRGAQVAVAWQPQHARAFPMRAIK